MCELFINAENHLWDSRTKSLRISGVVTSIRLEEFFWETLAEMAHRDGMKVNQMIAKLYLESIEADHDVANFTSFLRVCCSRYLSLIADGNLVRDENVPLAGVAVNEILEQEKQTRDIRKSRINTL